MDKPYHNNLFVNQFFNKEHALDFFQNYLPKQLVQTVDWKTLKVVPKDFIHPLIF